MLGLVQDAQLLTSATLRHAASVHPRQEVITADNGRIIHRYGYADADLRARRFASSLEKLGLAGKGVFLGALAWNTWRMFEVMHAVPGSGAMLHTANPRLHEGHLAYTVRHSNDQAMVVDLDCLPLAEAIAGDCPSVKTWILLCDPAEMPQTSLPNTLCYEDLVEAGDSTYAWPDFDERRAATLCYTSGTTGEPKGVLYSHRGTVLNLMTIMARDFWNLGKGSCVLATAAFFHCNGWGMPYMAPMAGARMVLPGRAVGPAAMVDMIRAERVTHTGGVPTVLLDILRHLDEHGGDLGGLELLWTGATAPAESLLRRLEALGPKVVHAFGMTETTQALTVSVPDPHSPLEQQQAEQLCQGQPLFLSGVRVADDDGLPLPSDGEAVGRLQLRGPSVASAYFGRPDLSPVSGDGWLDSGDIGTVGPEGHMTIKDRAKDAIKSGGEWISSVELENTAAGCPGVAEACCIGVEHPRWQERPVLLIVRSPDAKIDEAAVYTHLEGQIAKWWTPDTVIFVDSLPKNGVGKIIKAELRAQYHDILTSKNQ
ncbi:MAG: long-chain-fatty-acid--CoA ligase [Alphaproteobacteria bacterium]